MQRVQLLLSEFCHLEKNSWNFKNPWSFYEYLGEKAWSSALILRYILDDHRILVEIKNYTNKGDYF